MLSLRSARPFSLPLMFTLLTACSQVGPVPEGSTPLTSQDAPYIAKDLGTLIDGYSSYASGVSADGNTVLGSSYVDGEVHPTRWTEAAGLQDLGSTGAAAWVSRDGKTVAGISPAGRGERSFRWTEATGVRDIGDLGGLYTNARGMSADGKVIAGNSRTAARETLPFRWTEAGGFQDLGMFGFEHANATGVSADGKVIVGYGFLRYDPVEYPSSESERRAFRWTETDGAENLRTFEGGYSVANAVSADGNTVVGFGGDAGKPFVWTEAGGLQSLSDRDSQAYGVSANGKVIVGYSRTSAEDESSSRAIRWTRAKTPPTPKSATYKADFEGAPTGRPLYSLRVGQGVTGPATAGRISVGGNTLLTASFVTVKRPKS